MTSSNIDIPRGGFSLLLQSKGRAGALPAARRVCGRMSELHEGEVALGASPEGAATLSQCSLSEASRSNMLNTKIARRKLQQDVELLSNRVERLRQEERKAKQKVLETKLRGEEISALQKRNEQVAATDAFSGCGGCSGCNGCEQLRRLPLRRLRRLQLRVYSWRRS